MARRPTRKMFRAAAQAAFKNSNEIMVNDDAKVRLVNPDIESGAWVQCWYFFYDADVLVEPATDEERSNGPKKPMSDRRIS